MVTAQAEGNVAQMAREAEFSRNLKRAQQQQQQKQTQQEQHVKGLASGIKSSQYKAPPKTDAQQKQVLKEHQRWHARMITARKRKKRKKNLTKKYEKIIQGYNRVLWPLLYTAAFADALFDILTIPILSTILSFCTSLYINVVLWNVGPRKERTKRRLIRASASTLDLIPIINFIPISIIIVYKSQEDEKRRVRKAKGALKKISKL